MKFIMKIFFYIKFFFSTRYYAARLNPSKAALGGFLDMCLIIWLICMNLNLGVFLTLAIVPFIGFAMASAAVIHHLNKPIEEYEYEICEECNEDDDKCVCAHEGHEEFF